MKKRIYSKSELEEMARKHFNRVGAKVLYGTTDGQLFIHKHRAIHHAGKGTVYKIENEDAEEEEDSKLAKFIEAVKVSEDAERLADMLKKEVDGKGREEAIQALETRIEELTDPTISMNAKELIEHIEGCEDLELLNRIKEREAAKEDKARKTVVTALDERIAELSKD